MGREIRRVPPNWEHPRFTAGDARRPKDVGEYRSCYDQTFEEACAEWKEGFAQWEAGTHKYQDEDGEFWEGWCSPPDREHYRPAFTEEPTWYQVYQTVSEGTPVTPPFATREELIDYLVENGDFAYQEYPEFRSTSKPSREAATAFVNEGWAPSMVVNVPNDGSPATIRETYDAT